MNTLGDSGYNTAPEPGTALAIIPASSVSTILAADQGDVLKSVADLLKDYTPDGSTPEGREKIGSVKRKLGTARQDLLRVAAKLKEDHQKTIKAVNAEVKVIDDRFDALIAEVEAPRVAFEQQERDRVNGHEVALETIAACAASLGDDATLQMIDDALAAIKPLTRRSWQEFLPRAQAITGATVDKLMALRTTTEHRIAQEEELARLREAQAERDRQDAARAKAEHEARIAHEAAEKARRDAEAERDRLIAAEKEKAAREAQEAQRKADAEREAAEQAIKDAQDMAAKAEAARQDHARQAEQDRIELEAKAQAAAEKAEADRLAQIAKADADAQEAQRKAAQAQADAIEAERRRVAKEKADEEDAARKREANIAHRRKINQSALTAMLLISTDRMMDLESRPRIFEAIIAAIAKGEIPHIRIDY